MLKESITIHGVELNNRLVVPPMATELCIGGAVNEKLIEHYDKITQGGYVGLVITEHAYISKEGKASPRQLGIEDDSRIEGFKRITDVIHKNGSKCICQISHAGSNTTTDVCGGKVYAPSIVVNPRSNTLPDCELTQEDIDKIKSDFAAAAVRAKKAGYDGVEIHSAHGYLLNQFYSPITNKRTDLYSGEHLKGRTQLPREVIKAVREAVGEDYLIALRLGATDNREDGTTVEDSMLACAVYHMYGVDIFDISGGMCGFILKDNNEQGYFSFASEIIKKSNNGYVILTGNITDPKAADELLKTNKCDMVGVGRAVLQDYNWPRRCMESLKD